MKYILIIGDGMADDPVPALEGKTPLECAKKPVIDSLARSGVLGSVQNVPEGFPPGSDTAILSIFGCSPRTCYTGRAPLEAAAQGVMLNPGDAAFRCNNVAVTDGVPFAEAKVLSHSAGGLEPGEGAQLVQWLFEQPEFKAMADELGMVVHPTDSYRHIIVWQQAPSIAGISLKPPHDNLGAVVADVLPSGCPAAQQIRDLMELAHRLLSASPFNEARRAAGKLPANAIWFWAEGSAAALPKFTEQYGKTGTVISAVPLCHGIAALTGLDVIHVPGATGELDTNLEGKVEAALRAVEAYDFVAVHVEAPDECTHNGDLPGKIQSIEWLDSRVTAPLLEGLRARGEDFRVLILSDHKTLMTSGAHGGDPVPFIIYDSRTEAGSGLAYTEANGLLGPMVDEGIDLMPLLFEQKTL